MGWRRSRTNGSQLNENTRHSQSLANGTGDCDWKFIGGAQNNQTHSAADAASTWAAGEDCVSSTTLISLHTVAAAAGHPFIMAEIPVIPSLWKSSRIVCTIPTIHPPPTTTVLLFDHRHHYHHRSILLLLSGWMVSSVAGLVMIAILKTCSIRIQSLSFVRLLVSVSL